MLQNSLHLFAICFLLTVEKKVHYPVKVPVHVAHPYPGNFDNIFNGDISLGLHAIIILYRSDI